MRKEWSLVLAAVGLMATNASALSPNRLVVLIARPNDPRVAQQQTDLENDAEALRERDVVVQEITPEVAANERPELGVSSDEAFAVLLVGKDGEVKLRRDKPVNASEITALIDTMPMRRQEVGR